MQKGLLAELPSSCGYKNSVRAMDGFSRYCPANNKAKCLNNCSGHETNLTKHGCLPTTIICEQGSIFVSPRIKEAAVVLGFTPEHVTTKIVNKIGNLERTLVPMKIALKIETGDRV